MGEFFPQITKEDYIALLNADKKHQKCQAVRKVYVGHVKTSQAVVPGADILFPLRVGRLNLLKRVVHTCQAI